MGCYSRLVKKETAEDIKNSNFEDQQSANTFLVGHLKKEFDVFLCA